MNKLKFQLPQNILLTIYNSLILSQPNYCLLGWGYESKQLNKLQKRAIRIIDKSPRFSQTNPLFKKLKILKIHDILHLNQLKFYNKLLNNQLPEYFTPLTGPETVLITITTLAIVKIFALFDPNGSFVKDVSVIIYQKLSTLLLLIL